VGKFFRFRKPRLSIGKKGVKVSSAGASIGGKNFRVNLSKKGISTTSKVGKASYNSRRGCSMPLGILLLIAGVIIMAKHP
jgi:hypothetical protein